MFRSRKSKSDIELLQDKIKGIRVAMLTTVENDGSLHSRPMLAQEQEFDGYLWFFTLATTPKVEEVQQHRQVNLSYHKPSDNLCISVSGSVQLVHDRQKIKELWTPACQDWFPDGVDTPDLALLKVMVERAEYWEWTSGKGGILHFLLKKPDAVSGIDVKLNIRH